MDASPPVSIPRLSTPRLRLREYRLEDFDPFAAHLADPEAMVLGSCDRHTAWRIFGCQRSGGRGCASEALRFALEVRGERQARVLIVPGNAASIRVAQHLGLRRST